MSWKLNSPLSRIATQWVAVLLLFAVSLFHSLSVQAQAVLLQFADEQHLGLQAPTYALDPQAVTIDSSAMLLVRQGSVISLQVSEDEHIDLTISSVGAFLNGDRKISAYSSAGAPPFSLTLTVGESSLFGYLNSGDGIKQLHAIAREGNFAGWLYTPKSLLDSSSAFHNDYLIPDPRRFQGEATIIRPLLESNANSLPLNLNDGSTANDQVAATIDQITASNFRIAQKFSRSSVLVGTSVEAQYEFENISASRHSDLYVDIYFLLENTRLLLAPRNCLETLSAASQAILRCELGDFAVGEKKSFILSIQTTELSKPNVFSTALVGDVRSDAIINIVDDVTVDSDGDGISDFNEGLIGTNPGDPDSVDRSDVVIDVMALYTPGAAAAFPAGVDTRINQLVNVANQIYRDSGVGIQLRPVYQGMVPYNDTDSMDTALDHLIDKSDPAFSEVDELRARFGADLVMLFRPLLEGEGRCGLAPVGGFNTQGDFGNETEKSFAYSHLAIDCPVDIVVAHELGHNMGLTHSHIEDGAGGTFPFSTGYGVDSQFVTVMAYPGAFNTDLRIARFSNPEQDCVGFACGIASDEEFGADAVKSLNLVKYQIANYYPTAVPTLPTTTLASLTGTEVKSSIALAASSDLGLSHRSSLSPGVATDIDAEIALDPAHVGYEGQIHVLISLGSLGFVQLTSDGSLQPWNGSVEGLAAFKSRPALESNERIKLLDDYLVDSSLIGEQMAVFVAYQVPELGVFIYTANPLTLDIVANTAAQGEFEISDIGESPR